VTDPRRPIDRITVLGVGSHFGGAIERSGLRQSDVPLKAKPLRQVVARSINIVTTQPNISARYLCPKSAGAIARSAFLLSCLYTYRPDYT